MPLQTRIGSTISTGAQVCYENVCAFWMKCEGNKIHNYEVKVQLLSFQSLILKPRAFSNKGTDTFRSGTKYRKLRNVRDHKSWHEWNRAESPSIFQVNLLSLCCIRDISDQWTF
jgi:hypothetical protein